jgi:hypothetical protein
VDFSAVYFYYNPHPQIPSTPYLIFTLLNAPASGGHNSSQLIQAEAFNNGGANSRKPKPNNSQIANRDLRYEKHNGMLLCVWRVEAYGIFLTNDSPMKF